MAVHNPEAAYGQTWLDFVGLLAFNEPREADAVALELDRFWCEMTPAQHERTCQRVGHYTEGRLSLADFIDELNLVG
jgi:hypothetical protein